MKALVQVAAGLALSAFGCGPEAPDKLTLARGALDEGLPKRALAEVADAKAGPELVVRLAALVELDMWGDYAKLERGVPPGPERVALECLIAAARRDVDGEKRCRAVDVGAIDKTLADAAGRALGRVLAIEHRRSEAELQLRRLAEQHPTAANRKAVVAHLEREGYVREAVAYLEGWLAAEPADTSLKVKLVQVLERKVRGDLLDKRADEAEAAARRVLVLDPGRAQVRWFLADALEQKGDAKGAEAERAAAQAAGAPKPVAVDAMPEMDPRDQHPGDRHDEHFEP